jgi:hypothetical protein
MNEALWPAGPGYALEQLLAPLVGPAAVRAVREHFRDWVRGSGPLPTVRLGSQPYGIVPSTPLAHWQPTGRDVPPGLVELLNRARAIWRSSAARLPRIGAAGDDIAETLLTVLALQPFSLAYRGRSVLGDDYVEAAWRFMRQELDPSWWEAQGRGPRAVLDGLRVAGTPRTARHTLAAELFELPSPPVERDAADDEPLRANYLEWLGAERHLGYRAVRDESFPEIGTLPTPRPLLYLLVRHGLLLEYLAETRQVERTREQELVGVDELDDEPAAPRPPTPWDELATGARGRALDAAPTPALSDYRKALRTLAKQPVRTLERLMAETLDCCSHRLDAWATSIATRRLAAARASHGTATHVGGWGVVLDLEPAADARRSLGYVQAPSLTHAAAAGILAAGHVSHRPQDGRHPLAIDLSSARARAAMQLLEGVRAGRPLGALLGHRFERSLQDRGLPRLIAPFRAFAPLTPSAAGTDANVVDGLELHRGWIANGRRIGPDWPAAPADRPAIEAELAALDDAIDATGDLLVAEGTFQIARGAPARAAAALDAAAGRATPPAELEVAQTPREAMTITHRLLALLPEGAAAAPWASQSPRATAEPRLEAWAAQLLGPPDGVLCEVEHVATDDERVLATRRVHLDELEPSISALDVVYGAQPREDGGLSELEQRVLIHAATHPPAGVPLGAGVRLSAARPTSFGLTELMEVARAAGAALAGSRALGGADLTVPEAPTPAPPLADEIERRAAAALAGLRAAGERLREAAAAGDAGALSAALLQVSRFGVVGAVPFAVATAGVDVRAALLDQAASVVPELERRATQAEQDDASDADPNKRAEHAVAQLAAVFGPTFRALPLLADAAPAGPTRLDPEFRRSAELTNDPTAAATWLWRASRVRDGARRLADVLTYAETLSGPESARMGVDQLPVVDGDRWAGAEFGDAPPSGRLSLVAALPFGSPAGRAFAGLMVDEWTELVPLPEQTTGVAFHFDRPNACAPQAIILAVPPRPTDWTLDMLEAAVLQTVELAQARMVDLDAVQDAGHFLPAIQLAHNLRGATVATDLKEGRGCPVA